MTIRLNTPSTGPATPLHHYWSVCVGAGRANEGLRATWQEQLRTAADACGFRYVRFHGLFHDDMFVLSDGAYNFQYVDDLFDRLLDAGVRPFVELGFSPGELARSDETIFWWQGRIAPPADLGAWAALVTATLQHWVDRYGIEEVRQWYFEVWNEPNLPLFFAGTRSEYFELYRVTAGAVKQVDPQLRVGGPATSNFVPDDRFAGESEDLTAHAVVTTAADLDALDWRPVWLAEFLRFCAAEGLPVDFVSCHPYPTDWALDDAGTGSNYTRGVDSTRTDLALLRRMVDAGPFPDAEIHLTEWSSTPSSRDHSHDYPQAATFIVKAVLESAGLVDSLSYWTFTDVFEEVGAGPTSFHGGFGLLTLQGVAKPSFHAYRFLNQLGDELLLRAPGGVITRRDGRITALAYHYPPEMPLAVPLSSPGREVADRTRALGSPRQLELEITDLPPGAELTLEILGPDSGDPIAVWRTLGSPEPLSRADARTLRAVRPAVEKVYADERGVCRLNRALAPWTVLLVSQQPVDR